MQNPNNCILETRQHMDNLGTIVTVDADYVNGSTHRHPITCIAIKITGGAVFYKLNFLATITLTSTETEFVVVCEEAKVILYIHSILHDINI